MGSADDGVRRPLSPAPGPWLGSFSTSAPQIERKRRRERLRRNQRELELLRALTAEQYEEFRRCARLQACYGARWRMRPGADGEDAAGGRQEGAPRCSGPCAALVAVAAPKAEAVRREMELDGHGRGTGA